MLQKLPSFSLQELFSVVLSIHFWHLYGYKASSLLDKRTRNNTCSMLQPSLSSSRYQSSGLLLINHLCCGPVPSNLDANKTLLSVCQFHSYGSDSPCLQPVLFMFLLLLFSYCDCYFIRNSPTIHVTNLYMAPANPISLKMGLRGHVWANGVLCKLSRACSTCPATTVRFVTWKYPFSAVPPPAWVYTGKVNCFSLSFCVWTRDCSFQALK